MRRAEPHWVAPLYLALPLHLARHWEQASASRSCAEGVRPKGLGRTMARGAVASGLVLVALAHLAVLTSILPQVLGGRYVARYDLTNDLYAWRPGLAVVRRALVESLDPQEAPPVIVGPHWTVCAQVHAGLPGSVLVGCDGDEPADFERWLPRSTWTQAPTLLYVSDDRFTSDGRELAQRHVDAEWHANVIRGGRVVRRITVTRLKWAAGASTINPTTPPSAPTTARRDRRECDRDDRLASPAR
jgi:hypothetical protein